MTPLQGCLLVSALLFAIGLAGAVTRRNAILALVGIELMLNAANLALVAFGRQHGQLDAQVFVFFVMAVAALAVVQNVTTPFASAQADLR